MVRRFLYKAIFRCKQHYLVVLCGVMRRCFWRVQGMHIGRGTRVCKMTVTWPHKVSIGECCSLEAGVYFNAAGPYTEGISIDLGEGSFIGTGCEFNITSGLSIGQHCLIAAGTRFIDHNHGTALEQPIKEQEETCAPIRLGSDVWVGANALILQGVTIGEGAVVAAGSVVTRSVPPYSVVAGVPARPMRQRCASESTALRRTSQPKPGEISPGRLRREFQAAAQPVPEHIPAHASTAF